MTKKYQTITKLFLLFSMILPSLAGCSEEGDYREKVAKPVLKVTDKFLDVLIQGDADQATKLLIPDLRKAQGDVVVSKGIEALKSSPVTSSVPYQVVFYNVTGEIFGTHQEVTYQLQWEKGWLLVHIGVDDVYKRYFGVTDIDFRYIPMPLEELNAFTFKGKPWQHYAVLVGCVMIIVLVGVSFILLLRTKTRKRWIWWVWCFLIFIGFVRVSFNWTSGEMSIYPPAGAGQQVLYHLGWVVGVEHSSHYEPWYIQFMFPVGALAFLWRRKSLILRAEEEKAQQGL